MDVHVSAAEEGYIRRKLEAGEFASAEELVGEAVRRMRMAEEGRARLEAALQKGEDDIAAGRYEVLTPALWEEILAEADKLARDPNWEPDPDVVG